MNEELIDSGDNMQGKHILADPTVLTTQQLRHELKGVEREFAQRQETREREHTSLQELIDVRLEGINALNTERFVSQRREDDIREAHRLELKADNEKTVATAMVAAEKAVQAALAAAEKARDQQTIASQLATEKAEKAGKEQMEQQGATFTLAISGLTTGVNDVKTLVGELRAEKRAVVETTTERRAVSTQMIAVVAVAAVLFSGVISVIVSMIVKSLGI